jgi:putative addiction module component (TIGR02574 family)
MRVPHCRLAATKLALRGEWLQTLVTASTDEPLSQLLKRPANERARAARTLLESLDEADDDSSAVKEQAAELVRRMQAFHAGKVKLVDQDEVRRRILARLRSLRAQ